MDAKITQMTIADYGDVATLWRSTEGLGFSNVDLKETVEAHLRRNPGLSLVAREDGRLVGAVLCGHDGRRGSLHHLAVADSHRKRGLGRALVQRCLAGLRENGVAKCYVHVLVSNREGIRFWKAIGWEERSYLKAMSRVTGECGPELLKMRST